MPKDGLPRISLGRGIRPENRELQSSKTVGPVFSSSVPEMIVWRYSANSHFASPCIYAWIQSARGGSLKKKEKKKWDSEENEELEEGGKRIEGREKGNRWILRKSSMRVTLLTRKPRRSRCAERPELFMLSCAALSEICKSRIRIMALSQ